MPQLSNTLGSTIPVGSPAIGTFRNSMGSLVGQSIIDIHLSTWLGKWEERRSEPDLHIGSILLTSIVKQCLLHVGKTILFHRYKVLRLDGTGNGISQKRFRTIHPARMMMRIGGFLTVITRACIGDV